MYAQRHGCQHGAVKRTLLIVDDHAGFRSFRRHRWLIVCDALTQDGDGPAIVCGAGSAPGHREADVHGGADARI